MSKSRRSVRRGPVVLSGTSRRRRRPVRPRDALLAVEPEGPLPGQILVLLSKLHRAETGAADAADEKAG
ncbi:hypothetical protein MPOCJGCO_4517 [Methylobacterium trifolii]|uniref:Uncharacterized protein n=1 Tax=Methylobacterium trifolii TaxID=1003092 RepID=A0ABQ4U4M2_9HYPH|nr:hypothetical protein MPOCJGCO_4517 [Methylobacterium trifolii]